MHAALATRGPLIITCSTFTWVSLTRLFETCFGSMTLTFLPCNRNMLLTACVMVTKAALGLGVRFPTHGMVSLNKRPDKVPLLLFIRTFHTNPAALCCPYPSVSGWEFSYDNFGSFFLFTMTLLVTQEVQDVERK